MRGVAAAAGVGPSTMLRLAKRLGFESYDDFRKPFQEAMRTGRGTFADRAEWLQSLAGNAREGEVLSTMAEAAISNIETTFGTAEPETLGHVADMIRQARKVYVFSGGGLVPIAGYFNAVARMVLPSCVFIDGASGSVVDVLLHAGPADVMLVLSFEPYADATVRGARLARERGARVVALTDSRASPLAQVADAVLRAPTASPQFFPSQVAVVALLETLIALIVLRSDASTVENIDEIERLRRAHGFYWQPQPV
jgi:DNA-binding MurR/RpiR family transcriptional regulator